MYSSLLSSTAKVGRFLALNAKNVPGFSSTIANVPDYVKNEQKAKIFVTESDSSTISGFLVFNGAERKYLPLQNQNALLLLPGCSDTYLDPELKLVIPDKVRSCD